MRMLTKILAGSAGLAAFAAAAPASAQYYGYGYSPYAYGYGVNTSAAASQCTAAVQNRLYSRTGVGCVLGALLGVNSYNNARVLSITRVTPRANGTVRVSGLASSGRYAYNPYAPYGALGYSSMADLSFRCTVDYRGFVRDVDINRR